MSRTKADDIRELIEYHKSARQTSGEDDAVTKTRAYLRGDFLGRDWRRNQGADTDNKFFTSKNLIYAITDAAVTGLVGDNPKVSVQGENPESVELEPVVNGRLDKVFDANEIRESCVAALTDGVTVGRGVFKVGWGTDNWLRSGNMMTPMPMPTITTPDPVALFFDDSVRCARTSPTTWSARRSGSVKSTAGSRPSRTRKATSPAPTRPATRAGWRPRRARHATSSPTTATSAGSRSGSSTTSTSARSTTTWATTRSSCSRPS